MNQPAARAGVILDRDGTLIDVVRDEETGSISVAFHPNQLRLLPGVVSGLEALRDAGFALAIASNQPGPAKGQFSRAAVEATNQALLGLLAAHGIPIAALEVCLHHPQGGPGGDASLVGECDCRKPKPGMLKRIVARLGLEPAQSFMLGDSPGDVAAAHAAGLNAGLIFSRDRCELCPLRSGPAERPELDDSRFDGLARAVIAWRERAT